MARKRRKARRLVQMRSIPDITVALANSAAPGKTRGFVDRRRIERVDIADPLDRDNRRVAPAHRRANVPWRRSAFSGGNPRNSRDDDTGDGNLHLMYSSKYASTLEEPTEIRQPSPIWFQSVPGMRSPPPPHCPAPVPDQTWSPGREQHRTGGAQAAHAVRPEVAGRHRPSRRDQCIFLLAAGPLVSTFQLARSLRPSGKAPV